MSSSPDPIGTRRRRIDDRLACLPKLPPEVVWILAGGLDSDQLPARVQALVERNPKLSSRLLAAASGMEPVCPQSELSLAQAISRVGAQQVARLMTLLVLMRVFPPESEPARGLWRHTLRVATAARDIARARGGTLGVDAAYTIGILHDVGRFLLLDEELGELDRSNDEGWCGPPSLVEAERRLSGHDHAELGARLCQSWNLPEDVVQLVRMHHLEPSGTVELSASQLEALRIVQQADRIGFLVEHRPDLLELSAPERIELLERTCLHPDWDWCPAGPTLLDLLMGAILTRSDQRIATLGLAPGLPQKSC